MDVSNPFKLNHIKNMLRSDFDTVGPCVVMAAPGFMQVHALLIGYMSHAALPARSYTSSTLPFLACTIFILPFNNLGQHYSASYKRPLRHVF
jgi:hypothetical protein